MQSGDVGRGLARCVPCSRTGEACTLWHGTSHSRGSHRDESDEGATSQRSEDTHPRPPRAARRRRCAECPTRSEARHGDWWTATNLSHTLGRPATLGCRASQQHGHAKAAALCITPQAERRYQRGTQQRTSAVRASRTALDTCARYTCGKGARWWGDAQGWVGRCKTGLWAVWATRGPVIVLSVSDRCEPASQSHPSNPLGRVLAHTGASLPSASQCRPLPCHPPQRRPTQPTCLEWERANSASSTSCAQHITLRDGSEQYLGRVGQGSVDAWGSGVWMHGWWAAGERASLTAIMAIFCPGVGRGNTAAAGAAEREKHTTHLGLACSASYSAEMMRSRVPCSRAGMGGLVSRHATQQGQCRKTRT